MAYQSLNPKLACFLMLTGELLRKLANVFPLRGYVVKVLIS